jgi:trehalose 2-sulfotransferase
MTDKSAPEEKKEFESEFALSETFDFNFEAKLKQKYIILSSPRTGSTMLASALYYTGLAGVPFEYFHHNLLKARNHPERRPNELGMYLKEMIGKRTSPNGYFGMKLHFEQFEYLFGHNPTAASFGMRFLAEFDKFIMIFRRDKILQAISELLARETQVWSRTSISDSDLLRRPPNPNDVVAISDFLRKFVVWDQSWRKVIQRLETSCLEIAYEDLCDDPQAEFNKIFEHLDLRELRGRKIAFPTVKLTDAATTKEMKEAYLEQIGASTAMRLGISKEIVS